MRRLLEVAADFVRLPRRVSALEKQGALQSKALVRHDRSIGITDRDVERLEARMAEFDADGASVDEPRRP